MDFFFFPGDIQCNCSMVFYRNWFRSLCLTSREKLSCNVRNIMCGSGPFSRCMQSLNYYFFCLAYAWLEMHIVILVSSYWPKQPAETSENFSVGTAAVDILNGEMPDRNLSDLKDLLNHRCPPLEVYMIDSINVKLFCCSVYTKSFLFILWNYI